MRKVLTETMLAPIVNYKLRLVLDPKKFWPEIFHERTPAAPLLIYVECNWSQSGWLGIGCFLTEVNIACTGRWSELLMWATLE